MSILTTGGGGQHAIVATSAARFLQLLLADRGKMSLRAHPALRNLAFAPGVGSLNHTLTSYGLDGYDLLIAHAEGTELSETALTTAARTLAIAPKGMRRDLGDLVRSIDPTGQLNPLVLANDGFRSAMATLGYMIAQLSGSWSANRGTSGLGFTHDLFMEGRAALIASKVPGPYIAVLDQNHFADWSQDLGNLSGVAQWQPATAEMQQMRGSGYQGKYLNFDVFTNDGCASSGSDKVSQMFGAGGVGYGEQQLVYDEGADLLLNSGPIAVERERSATKSQTTIVTHYAVGTVITEQARGVGLLAAV
jgi:hypothetical protein